MTEPEQWAEALWDHLLNKTFSRSQAIEAIQRAFEERERELREDAIAQPSGDVVEAVARALFKRENSRGEWDEYHEVVQAGYLATATAAITAYEAVSGVAKMRAALRPFANVTILPDGSVVGLERHWFTDARAALGEKP